MPPSVQRSNAKHYKSNTITEIKEYEGRAHLLPAQEGWEEVADYALDLGRRQRIGEDCAGRRRRHRLTDRNVGWRSRTFPPPYVPALRRA